MRPTVSELLLLAQRAFEGGDLHGAAEAFRQVLDQEPEHGSARALLTQVEGQIEATLDDSFDVITDSGAGRWAPASPRHPDAVPPEGIADDVSGPQLPESEAEVEFADLVELEAYATLPGGEPSVVTSDPSDEGPGPAAGELRAPAAVPILVASPTPAVELSPAGSREDPLGRSQAHSTAEEQGAGPPDLTSASQQPSVQEEADVPRAPAVGEGPDPAVFPDVVEVSPEDVVEAPAAPMGGSRSMSEPQVPAWSPPPARGGGGAPPPGVEEEVEASPAPEVVEVEASPEAWPEAADVVDAFPASSAESTSDLDAEEDPQLRLDPEAVLQPLLQEVPSDRGEGDLDMHAVLEPISAAPEVAADPSEALVIEAMPTPDPDPEPEDYWGSMPEALPVVVATEPRMPAVSAKPTLSGVIHRKRTRPPTSVMENTGDWSGVDLAGGGPEGREEAEVPDVAMTFAAPEGSAASGGLAAAVAAFQSGDPIAAYALLVDGGDDEANDPSRREFLERLAPIVESELRARIGPMDAVADLAVSPASLTALDLDHRAGFVLSQIDGFVSFDDIVDLSGMDQLATLRILVRLLDAGAIRR